MKKNKMNLILSAALLCAVCIISACSAAGKVTPVPSQTPAAAGVEKSDLFKPDEEGNLRILSESLTTEKISFIRPSEDSKLELLARKDGDGNVRIALGTCQSCNGSPMAYYTQTGDLLRCNNCGQTFPISVVDHPGGGCHPIMIDEKLIKEIEGGILLNMDELKIYEPLFAKVAEH